MGQAQETKKKVCFVIMGFGKKTDYRNGREVEMDVVYNDVIRKVFKKDFPEYILIRADEVAGSQIIDVSMYTLIMKADLVIADITTMNLNAVYELGTRHALKPYSTIIMVQKSDAKSLPFDLSHSRVLSYKDYGEKMPKEEAKKVRKELKSYIESCGGVDSPIFTVLPEGLRPQNIESEYKRVVQYFMKDSGGKGSWALYEEAKAEMALSHFKEAEGIWEKLQHKFPGEDYIVQQLAMAQYKSKLPNEEKALQRGLKTIKALNPDTSMDLETLGITGAIYKRMYQLHGKADDLGQAIGYYQKGYLLKDDYYNGENYAYCLLEKANREDTSKEESVALTYLARQAFQSIAKRSEQIISECPKEQIEFWMYATLSASYYYLGDLEKFERYRDIFLERAEADWQKDTYEKQLEKLKGLM